MPTYDYVCDACEHAFDHFQSMSSNILRTCPQCKKRKLRRLIGSGAGVIFKGSGFYETDYKKKKQPKPQAESSDAKSESKSDSESKPSSAKSDKTSSDSGSSKKTTKKKSED